MEKHKLILPISILLGCIILGGFIYASQVNKQKSIERQQEIDLQVKSAELKAKIGADQAKVDKDDAEKRAMAAQLENCLNVANQEYKRKMDGFVEIFNKNCANPNGWTNECHTVFNESLKKYETEKKQDIDDCYNRFK